MSLSLPMAPARARRPKKGFADRTTIWAIWALVLCGVIREALGQTLIASFGFYSLHIIDPPVFLAFLAIGANLIDRPFAKASYTLPILVIATIILVNFGRGMEQNSALALLWFRSTAAIVVILLLALVAKPETAHRTMRNSLRVGAVLLSILLIFRIPFGYSFLMTRAQEDGILVNEGRLLSVVGAFLMLIALSISLSEVLRSKRLRMNFDLFLVIALPIIIKLTGQGTVMIAMIVSMAVIFILERGPYQIPRFFLGCAVGVIALLAQVAFGSLLSLGEDDAFLAQRAGNLHTRQIVWDALMETWPTQSATNQFFGIPGGSSLDIFVNLNYNYGLWRNSVHSMYYGSLPIMGYVGLFFYIALLAILLTICFAKLFTSSRKRILPSSALACCIITIILSYSYEIRNEEVLALFWPVILLRGLNSRTMPQTMSSSTPSSAITSV